MIVTRPFYILEASLYDPGCLWLASLCLQYERASVGLDNLEFHVAVSFSDCTMQSSQSSTVSSNHSQTCWCSGSAAMVPFSICLLLPALHLDLLKKDFFTVLLLHFLALGFPLVFSKWDSLIEDRWVSRQRSVDFAWILSCLKTVPLLLAVLFLCHHNSCQEA